jgi:cold shock CspA family protein
MQGTVRTFDAGTRTGSVLLDDGTELPFDAEAFAAGGLRMLRFGQRVNLALDGAGDGVDEGKGRIRAITLSTFPLPPAG